MENSYYGNTTGEWIITVTKQFHDIHSAKGLLLGFSLLNAVCFCFCKTVHTQAR